MTSSLGTAVGGLMQELIQKIREQGKVSAPNVLRVDSFLNHQLDPQLMDRIGREFAELFADAGVTKVMTIETSGIAPAIFAGLYLQVPVLFAKKSKSLTLTDELYTAEVFSFTKQKEYQIVVERKYLTADDTVLLIDDFLAAGEALKGLIGIVEQAGAELAGCGIVIEKGFQGGGDRLREQGVVVKSLAIIDSMDDHQIIFRVEPEESEE